jgi:hypothetical protein
MDAINWHGVIGWAVVIGAPLLGGLIWVLAYGGQNGERRNRMWTQGPFVPTGEDKARDKNE